MESQYEYANPKKKINNNNKNISGYCEGELHSNCHVAWCDCDCHKEKEVK